jgi:hypothetical protein
VWKRRLDDARTRVRPADRTADADPDAYADSDSAAVTDTDGFGSLGRVHCVADENTDGSGTLWRLALSRRFG